MVRSHLDEKMHQKTLFEWNSATADYPRDRCLHQLFEEQVAKDGQATALVCGAAQIDYQTLNARANQPVSYTHLEEGIPEVGQDFVHPAMFARCKMCIRDSIEHVRDHRDLPLWDNPLILVIAVTCFGLNWMLRRRWGYA